MAQKLKSKKTRSPESSKKPSESSPAATMVLLNQRNVPIPASLQEKAKVQMGGQYAGLLLYLQQQRAKNQLDRRDRVPFDPDSQARLKRIGLPPQEISGLELINSLPPIQRRALLATEADFLQAYRREVAAVEQRALVQPLERQ